MYPMTPWVKRLLIANVAMFLAQNAVPPVLLDQLVFYPLRPDPALGVYRPDLLYKPWTLVTYMFLHAGIWHVGLNMLMLFFFGPRLEQRLGSGDFLKLYFLAGIGGALLSFAFARNAPIIGASAAVYGIMVGFAMFWPRERIYIWGILPIEAWLLVTLGVIASLWSGISGAQEGVAHFAHLGGLAFGYGYLKLRDWRRGANQREFKKKMEKAASGGQSGGSFDRGALRRWEAIDLDRLHEINRAEVATLLQKAHDSGVRSLSPAERQFMDRMAMAAGR